MTTAVRRPPDSPPRTGRRATVLLLLAGILIMGTQFLVARIPSIDQDQFRRSAVELERRGGWRYGYVPGPHGAQLVKSRMSGAEPAVVLPEDDLSALMAVELRGRRLRALLELFFYGAVLTIVGVMARSLAGMASRHRQWRSYCGAVAAAAGIIVTLALSPYVLAGYGEPLFSTSEGPGSLMTSSTIAETAVVPASVSYRYLVELLVGTPAAAASAFAGWLSDAVGTRLSLWLVATVFWASLAAALAAVGARQRVQQPGPPLAAGRGPGISQ